MIEINTIAYSKLLMELYPRLKQRVAHLTDAPPNGSALSCERR
jgi:hypothetical protein